MRSFRWRRTAVLPSSRTHKMQRRNERRRAESEFDEGRQARAQPDREDRKKERELCERAAAPACCERRKTVYLDRTGAHMDYNHKVCSANVRLTTQKPSSWTRNENGRCEGPVSSDASCGVIQRVKIACDRVDDGSTTASGFIQRHPMSSNA